MPAPLPRYCLSSALALLLAACSPPPAPQPDKAPPPQATQLSQAIHRPLDQAKDAQQAVQQADADQAKQIEAATGQ